MNSPDGSDRKLAQRISGSGDEAAFRQLYRRHTPALHAFVSRWAAGSDADVEDAVQEAWIRAVESLDGFRWESSFRSWLIGIGLNCCREMLRRKRTQDRLEFRGADAGKPNGAEMKIDLQRAVAALPDGYRTVLLLHDLEGFTHPEIGKLLGIAVGTAKSQLHSARRAVRQMLEPPEDLL